jgi:hypothetical protein
MEQEQLNGQSEIIVSQLISGKRPEGMSYDEFRIKRKAINAYLKRRSKGTLLYTSKVTEHEIDENGGKTLVTKIYSPYKKKQNV